MKKKLNIKKIICKLIKIQKKIKNSEEYQQQELQLIFTKEKDKLELQMIFKSLKFSLISQI
jgi:hypothetical protein